MTDYPLITPTVELRRGDMLAVLPELPEASIDAVITDPPYGISFMGRGWDQCVPGPDYWRECLRVLKPGGHLLAFGGTRTYHRLACAIEDAGFEIRDTITWLYGQGFPKSLDVSKVIDKAAGVQREVIGRIPDRWTGKGSVMNRNGRDVDNGLATGEPATILGGPATDAARQWQGWGTALKPASEPVVCARKPFNVVPSWGLVSTVHHALGGLLWLSASPAKRAEMSSPSSPHALPAGTCASALATAALASSPGASGETATYSSPVLASTSLSIVSSWNAILGALSAPTTTCTTSTASSTTTALKTLNSLLAPVTSPSTMPRCECLTGGSSSPAKNADESSSDAWARWRHTLSASAPETAIEGIALGVCSVLASVAADLSSEQVAASSALAPAQTAPVTTNGVRSGSSASEPIVLARKPLAGTVAACVQAHGTGALNIDGCRVGTTKDVPASASSPRTDVFAYGSTRALSERSGMDPHTGRWPANVLLSHLPECVEVGTRKVRTGVTVNRNRSDGKYQPPTCYGEHATKAGDDVTYAGADGFEVIPAFECAPGCAVAELDAQSGTLKSHGTSWTGKGGAVYGGGRGFTADMPTTREANPVADSGGASRFFATFRHDFDGDDIRPVFKYQAKAPTAERPKIDGKGWPTVKPLGLMKWLVRLVTPPGGIVLDPFAGTAPTLQAARLEGFDALGIECDEFAYRLGCQRLGLPVTWTRTGTATGRPVVTPLVRWVERIEQAPVDPVLAAIEAAPDYDALRAIWRTHRLRWTVAYTDAATQRRTQFAQSLSGETAVSA